MADSEASSDADSGDELSAFYKLGAGSDHVEVDACGGDAVEVEAPPVKEGTECTFRRVLCRAQMPPRCIAMCAAVHDSHLYAFGGRGGSGGACGKASVMRIRT